MSADFPVAVQPGAWPTISAYPPGNGSLQISNKLSVGNRRESFERQPHPGEKGGTAFGVPFQKPFPLGKAATDEAFYKKLSKIIK